MAESGLRFGVVIGLPSHWWPTAASRLPRFESLMSGAVLSAVDGNRLSATLTQAGCTPARKEHVLTAAVQAPGYLGITQFSQLGRYQHYILPSVTVWPDPDT